MAVRRKRKMLMIETAKTAVSSLQAARRLGRYVVFVPTVDLDMDGPLPRGVMTLPEHELAPWRVNHAIAIKQPMKHRSRKMAMAAKKASPPRNRVVTTTKRPYRTAAPDMPSTALVHVWMCWWWCEREARK